MKENTYNGKSSKNTPSPSCFHAHVIYKDVILILALTQTSYA